jgi:GR25 family glycosyltransferase involved in LPS biosynthesis
MKSFIISLSKISSSWNSALETKRELLKIGISAELFEGTYGLEAEKLFLSENRTLSTFDQFNTSKTKMSSPGVKGCFHSHYRLWKRCIELNEPIMIFEDDLVVYRPFETINFQEVLILSINYDWKKTFKYRKYLEESYQFAEAIDYKLYFMPGCSGYIIKPIAAKKLIDFYDFTNTYGPADIAINSNLVKMELHSKLIARSKTMNEKISLTRFEDWK